MLINFGGIFRKKKQIKNNYEKSIIGVGYFAADELPIKIKGIIIQIYSHFHIFTIRVKKNVLRFLCR